MGIAVAIEHTPTVRDEQRHVRIVNEVWANGHRLYELECDHAFTITILRPGQPPEKVACQPPRYSKQCHWFALPLRDGQQAIVDCGHAHQAYTLPLRGQGHIQAKRTASYQDGLEEWQVQCTHLFTERRTYPGAPQENDRYAYPASLAEDGLYRAAFLLPANAAQVIACEHEEMVLRRRDVAEREVAE